MEPIHARTRFRPQNSFSYNRRKYAPARPTHKGHDSAKDPAGKAGAAPPCARHRGGSPRATTRPAPTQPRRSPQARTTELMIAERSKPIGKATRSSRLQGCASSRERERLALTVARRRDCITCSSRWGRTARGSQQASRIDGTPNEPIRPKSRRPPTLARLPRPSPEQQSVERCRQQQLHFLHRLSEATSWSRSAAPEEELSALAPRPEG